FKVNMFTNNKARRVSAQGPEGGAMKIVIPGGSGHLGRILCTALRRRSHEVVVLSRRPSSVEGARVVGWDGRSLGAWADEIDGADVVINLAGRSVNCRYTRANLREMIDSRVLS